jgi:hypothetical protein
MSKGLLVEIEITDLVWDERTDGTYEYAVDRIEWFIDELSDCNKILPHNFKEVDATAILIQINNKLISHVNFQPEDWDEDAMTLSLFLVLDFKNGDDINTYFLKEHNNKSLYCHFPKDDLIVYQAYDYGSYHNSVRGYYNSSETKTKEDYTNYTGDAEMENLYNEAKSILVK